MKSKHRHDLETNELAKRLNALIEQIRPYSTAALSVVIAVLVVLIGWSWLSGSSDARQAEAWAMYNVAVEGASPNLPLLRQSAQDHPGTAMQELADITWADGQVFQAGRFYISNRPVADEALNRAESTYLGLLRTSKSERIIGRTHFGLGRIYELQNELDRARKEYNAVQGDFAELAAARAKQLDEQRVQRACDWLATAQPPRVAPPTGPGTPGQRPDFSATDMKLPGETPQAGATTDGLLQGIDVGIEETPDRYGPADPEFFGPTATGEPADQPADSGQSGDGPADDAPADDGPADDAGQQ